MTELNRRIVLAGAAAATAMGPLAAVTPAGAAAPASGKQAPGYYRYKVGDFEVTAILDGVRQVKLGTSPARNAKLEDVQALLAASRLPTDQVGYYFHPTLVNTGSKLVLLDTGNGPGSLQAGTGMTPANLAAAGVDPTTIDIVVISHFHGDHISGLRTADGALAYPNAEIKIPAKEWAYWSDEGNASRAPQGQTEHLPEHQAYLRPDRRQGDPVRVGQGGRARHHGDRQQRPHARPYFVRHRVRQRQGPDPGRRHGRLRAALRHQPGLACRRRHGRPAGGAVAAQALRHAGSRAACWSRAIISRSRRSATSTRRAMATALSR